jgi:DNA topoisomerase I
VKEKGKRIKKADLPERPKMKSLLPGQTPETLTLPEALRLLSLPRAVGVDPANGETIVSDLGRFGPYIKRGEEYRSLPTPESLFTVTEAEALALLAQPKKFRRGQPQPIREVGKVPETQAPVQLMNGRFGPYVTDGEINASLQRGTDPAHLTLEEALSLLANRRAAGPPMRRPAKPRRSAAAGGPKLKVAKQVAEGDADAKPARTAKGKASAKAGAAKPSPEAKAPAKPSIRKKGERAAS